MASECYPLYHSKVLLKLYLYGNQRRVLLIEEASGVYGIKIGTG